MTKTPRERIIIGNNGKDKVVVTVKRDAGDKRHIFITVPSHMRWTTIWKTLRKLPRHLENERKQKKAKSQQKSAVRTKTKVR